MHYVNLLTGPCTLRNHFDCDHDMPGRALYVVPGESLTVPYLASGIDLDTAQYLSGWSTVAGLDEDEASLLWLMLEANGCNSDLERGVRDGLEAAFGN